MIESAPLWILAAVALVTYCIKWIISKCQRDPRMVKLAKTLDGPPGLPIVGNSIDLYRKGDRLKLVVEFDEKYGSMYRLWLGKYLAVVVSDVNDLEAIFMSSKVLGKPRLFRPFEDFFGDGIFTTRSIPKWKNRRKTFQPLFGRSALPRYTSIINEKVDVAANLMEHLVDGPEFDAWDYLPNLAFDIILKVATNVDADRNDKLLQQYYSATLSGFEMCFRQLCLPWLQHWLIEHFLYKKKSQQYRGKICEFLRKIIKDTKEEILQQIEDHKNKVTSNTEDIPPKRFATVAYELSELEKDEIAMLDEILIILSGGTDPSLITTLFLLMVAIHQDIQNKLYDELYEVFGDSDRAADENDLDRLPYLEQVLKETLRRFPVIPYMLRETEENVKIRDRVIPAGTMVFVSIGAVHFNLKHYPDPWKFNPDNFSPEAVEKRHKLAFLPFSAGLRNCMGMNFAMFEMKLTLSALLRKFSFFTKMKMEDVYMDNSFIFTSVNGYKMTIKSRVRKPTYLKK